MCVCVCVYTSIILSSVSLPTILHFPLHHLSGHLTRLRCPGDIPNFSPQRRETRSIYLYTCIPLHTSYHIYTIHLASVGIIVDASSLPGSHPRCYTAMWEGVLPLGKEGDAIGKRRKEKKKRKKTEKEKKSKSVARLVVHACMEESCAVGRHTGTGDGNTAPHDFLLACGLRMRKQSIRYMIVHPGVQ